MHHSCKDNWKLNAKQMEDTLWLMWLFTTKTCSQTKMKYNSAIQNERLLVLEVGCRLPSIFAKLHKAWRDERPKIFRVPSRIRAEVRAGTKVSKNPNTEPIINIIWAEKRSNIREASKVGVFVRKSLQELTRGDALLALEARIPNSRELSIENSCFLKFKAVHKQTHC